MKRILSQTVLLTTTDECDYHLTVRIVPNIPSLNGRHFAAKPSGLASLREKAAISTRGLLESYGVTEEDEEDAARACVEKVEQLLTIEKISNREHSPLCTHNQNR